MDIYEAIEMENADIATGPNPHDAMTPEEPDAYLDDIGEQLHDDYMTKHPDAI